MLMKDDGEIYAAETNPLPYPNFHKQFEGAKIVDWTEKGLKIVRLRLLTDPCFPYWDVSYCRGFIGEEPVKVQLPFNQLPKKHIISTILSYAKRDGVYAKGLGLLDPLVISKLW